MFLASIVGNLCHLNQLLNHRAITGGIIGGKTWSYLPLAYGLPLINVGVTVFLYGDDYGTDPRAFLGWENETKAMFFYTMLSVVGVMINNRS